MKKSLATAIIFLFIIGAPSVRADLIGGREAFLRGDYAMALHEWRPLAEQGVAEAQSNLGRMYKLGLGVPRDYAEAVRWYRRASMQGDLRAYNDVGGAFYTGKGVPRDFAEAARWFRKASERGDTKAQFNLGLMYAKGEGVARDDIQAYKWFYLAASRARPGKTRHRMSMNLNYVAGRMIPAQLDEARRMVREWIAKFQEAEWIAKFQEARNRLPSFGPSTMGG